MKLKGEISELVGDLLVHPYSIVHLGDDQTYILFKPKMITIKKEDGYKLQIIYDDFVVHVTGDPDGKITSVRWTE